MFCPEVLPRLWGLPKLPTLVALPVAGLIRYRLVCVAPNSTPSLYRKANDSMPFTLKAATLMIVPLVLLNVTKTVVLDMPYNVPFVGQ